MEQNVETIRQIGNWPVIRRLWPADKMALRNHLLRLEADNRDWDFCGGSADQTLISGLECIDWQNEVMLGAFEGAELRGVATLSLNADSDVATIALSTEIAFQNRGLGTKLLDRMFMQALSKDIARVDMICLSQNRAIADTAEKLGARVMPYDADAPLQDTYLSLISSQEHLHFWLVPDHPRLCA